MVKLDKQALFFLSGLLSQKMFSKIPGNKQNPWGAEWPGQCQGQPSVCVCRAQDRDSGADQTAKSMWERQQWFSIHFHHFWCSWHPPSACLSLWTPPVCRFLLKAADTRTEMLWLEIALQGFLSSLHWLCIKGFHCMEKGSICRLNKYFSCSFLLFSWPVPGE